MSAARRVMFLYWGRRGSLGKFAHDLHAEALGAGVHSVLSVSRQNTDFAGFAGFGDTLLPVDTFGGTAGALAGLWRIPGIRRALVERIARDRVDTVVNLIPHLWTPLVLPRLRRAGATTLTVIHDAAPHPGDRLHLLNDLLVREALLVDRAVTLSSTVRTQLMSRLNLPADRVATLFHPDLDYRAHGLRPVAGEPFRLLFLGRIMRYKGVAMLAEAARLLEARGVPVKLSVYGEGDLSDALPVLDEIGATVVNSWISDDELQAALASHHAVALPYVEASQSGVASAAFASGLPVVATPVGGLVEQIRHGENGLVAADVTAAALADAIATLAADRQLHARMAAAIAADRGARSMKQFLFSLLAAAGPSA